MNVAIVGTGNLGAAIARGLDHSKFADKLLLVNRTQESAQSLAAELGSANVVTLDAAITQSDILILAVKPAAISLLADGIKKLLTESLAKPLIISVATKPDYTALVELFGGYDHLARVMPCIAVEKCSGVAAVYSENIESLELAIDVFSKLGSVLKVRSEEEFDAVLGVAASGLGFMALVAEALAEGGMKMGLGQREALECAAYTLLGAGVLLEGGRLHPADLRQRVASPGGTTLAGLAQLEKVDVRGAFINAIEAAVNKARER